MEKRFILAVKNVKLNIQPNQNKLAKRASVRNVVRVLFVPDIR